MGSAFLQQFALEFVPSRGYFGSQATFLAQNSALTGVSAGGDKSDGSVILPILLVFLVVALLLAAISYVCFRCVQKKRNERA